VQRMQRTGDMLPHGSEWFAWL